MRPQDYNWIQYESQCHDARKRSVSEIMRNFLTFLLYDNSRRDELAFLVVELSPKREFATSKLSRITEVHLVEGGERVGITMLT